MNCASQSEIRGSLCSHSQTFGSETTPSAYPFHELDSVIMTPHYSATSDDTYRLRAAEVAENLAAFARGDVPEGFVYRTELDT